MKKYKWVFVLAALIGSLLFWAQTFNVMCDQDVSFFTGACTINKFIPW